MTNTLPPTAPFVGINVAKDLWPSCPPHRPVLPASQRRTRHPSPRRTPACPGPRLDRLGGQQWLSEPPGGRLVRRRSARCRGRPASARRFAEASGKLAKTDPLDAACLAHFAEAIRPQPRPLPMPIPRLWRHCWLDASNCCTCASPNSNAYATVSGSVRRDIQQHLGFLERHLRKVDKELKQTVQRSPVWREQDDLLQSVPGIGPQVGAGAFGRAARAGDVAQPQARRFGRPGTVQPRQWSLPRPASHLRRSFGGACGVVPGGRGGHAFQCSAGTLLPGSVRHRAKPRRWPWWR